MQTQTPIAVLAGRYALEEELGRSGTGMSWRASDRLLGRTVRVELVHPRLGDDPMFAGRLGEEAQRVASLTAPGIVRLLDSGQEDGVPFLVYEHVEAPSARSRLTGGPLPAQDATRIAIALLEALAPVHEAGVLHLHLELDDVLLPAGGDVRLSGLAVGAAVTATRTPATVARLLAGGGLAPEQLHGRAVSERTDVFAVGAILFALLTGEPSNGRRSPRGIRPSVPRWIDRVVARALAPEAANRFDGVRSFASALGARALAAPSAERRGHGGLGAWLGVPIAIALVAAGVIAAGLWLDRLEVGGPLGIRPAHDATPVAPAAPTTRAVRPISVAVFDPPPGDGTENDSTVLLAIDGDPSTAWRSENYFDGLLNKDGVGLVFDLGRLRDVVGFHLSTPGPGFLFHIAVGDDPDALVAAVGEPLTADLETNGVLRGSGRYLLVWITTVVEVQDGHRAEIAEFEVVVGTDA